MDVNLDVPGGHTDEWHTPQKLFAVWNAEFNFTLDVCATPESAKCNRYFTQEHDGLSRDWTGERAWMNCPYSSIYPWVEKAWEEVRGGAELVVGLLPAWTDRAWWQRYIEPMRDVDANEGVCTVETRFLRGRIRFGYPGNPSGAGGSSPTFPSVLVIWRPY
jgi:phage N-6-adenine-methyltransferase